MDNKTWLQLNSIKLDLLLLKQMGGNDVARWDLIMDRINGLLEKDVDDDK